MANLPSGAESLLIALNTPGPKGMIGIPILIWGRPGVGKSSFIEGLASDEWKVLTIIASIHDPTDFSGLPVYDEGVVKYVAPSWIDSFEDHANGILFLDELSTCPPSIQAALLRVIFERKVGFKSLPDHVRIVAAANPPDLIVGGWELSPPMRNRFVHLDWDISTDLFIRSLAEGWQKGVLLTIDPKAHEERLSAWKDKIAAFLKISPDALHGDPEKEMRGYASPRSWEYVIHLLASCEVLGLPPNLELMQGCLGEGIAIALVEYLSSLKQPDPKAVLSKQLQIKLNEFNDGEIFVLFNGMERVLQDSQEKAHFLTYADTFLSLTQQLTLEGRRDVVFVSLQRLAKAGFLTKVISQARIEMPNRYTDYMNKITQLFADEGIVEFIDVLT
jgi:hypothetical protein